MMRGNKSVWSEYEIKITEEIYQKIELDKIDIKCASNGPLRKVYKMAVQIHVHKIDKCLQFLCLIFFVLFVFYFFFYKESGNNNDV